MSLINTIKSDQIQARKERKTAEALLLTTLLGEATRIGKDDGNRETTDEEVVAVVKKFIKGNDEVMKLTDPDSNAYLTARTENSFVSQYLPQQMTEEFLRGVIEKIIQNGVNPNMGSVMKQLKEVYGGEYDGRMASTIAKDILQS